MGKRIVPHRRALTITAGQRAEVRRQVIEEWLRELPGTSEVRHTYHYDVEEIRDGSRIYLLRPARLNKGMDFVIHCENFLKFKKGTSKPPAHKDLLREIEGVCVRSQKHRAELRIALGEVWNCQSPDKVMASLVLLNEDVLVERALKLAKWMFIEQDLTYWTESGRWMLRSAIEQQIGPLG